MFLPSHNARLSAVLSPGSSEDYDAPAGAGTAKWQGDAEALYVEQVLEQVNGQTVDAAKQTRLEIPSNLGVTVDVNDYVTYTPLGSATTLTRRVKATAAPELIGIVKLFLWDTPEP